VHITRMSRMCARLARAAGMSPEDCDMLLHAAPMHDVGKIGIPDRILLKPGKLAPAEWEVMQSHTTIGARVLEGSDSPVVRMAERIALMHHERWDGSGYPHGIEGEDIPLVARICAVCDVFDALISTRPYKRPWPVADALAEIERQAGTHFDPRLARLFVGIYDEQLREIVEDA
jgi:putative two-component system response regulator